MVAKLETRYIFNANAGWARSDLGPLDDLRASIKRGGIKKPILLKPDFLVIDGARRLAAAHSLDIKMVPVVICRSWDDVKANFNPMAEDAAPMYWPDLTDFWLNILTPIYRKHSQENGDALRKSGEATPQRPVYSGYVVELSEIYGTTPSIIKSLRDYMQRLRKYEERFPIFYKGAMEAMPRDSVARDLVLTRAMKMAIENLVAGNVTEEEALSIFQRRMAGEKIPRTRRIAPRVSNVNIQFRYFDDLLSYVEMLENLSNEANQFHKFGLSRQEADKIITRMKAAITPITRMRKRLDNAAKTGEGKES